MLRCINAMEKGSKPNRKFIRERVSVVHSKINSKPFGQCRDAFGIMVEAR